MKKKSILISSIFLFCLTFQLFAEDSPLENYKYRHKLYGAVETTFQDGTKKIFESLEEEYNETDGWAYIKGYGKIHYWLYNTYRNLDGHGDIIYYRILPEWAEEMGYAIDFDNVRDIDYDQDMPSSVKSLMEQRDCNVAAALITSDTSYPYGKSPYLVVHGYDRDEDSYWTYFCPLY